MYATKTTNGILSIQRDGRNVLRVYDQNLQFATWVCAVLNHLGHLPQLLLTDEDLEWLRAMDGAFRPEVQHA